MAVYTRKGDKGNTGLYDASGRSQKRVSKDSVKVVAIGTVDELNSFVGLAASSVPEGKMQQTLQKIQSDLLRIGSILAGSGLGFPKSKTGFLESEIDKIEGKIPALGNFIVPGGHEFSARLHVCRSVSRRAEREIVALSNFEKIPDNVRTYLNRLSDFFFMYARFANFQMGISDLKWTGKI